MKIPVPKTLPKAITPMILCNLILGIGVMEYPIGRPRRMISACWSLVNFSVYLIFVNMMKLSEITEFEGSRIAANSYQMHAYLSIMFIATSYYLAQTRAKTVKNTFSKLDGMNDRLNILGIPNDYKLLFKTQIIQLGAASAWIFALFVLGLKYVGFDFSTESSRIAFLMASHYFLIYAFVVDCTFNVSVRYFGNRFRRLNKLLVKLDSPKRRSRTTVTQKTDDQLQRYNSLVINEIYRINSQAIKAANQRWLLYVIRETRKIHRGLCKLAMELNRAFGIQALFSVTLSLFLIISLLYSSYHMAVVPAPSNISLINSLIPGITGLMVMMIHVAKLLLIVDACETASSEANRTGESISKLLDTAACDEDIRDEINIFSLQLIQNPLNFTACGFFTFNYSLVRGIIGSVATYLVIMIQMRSIYEPENLDPTSNSTMLESQTNGTY